MMNKQANLITVVMALGISYVWAQDPAVPAKTAAETMPEMDHSDVQGRTSVAEDRMSGATQMNHGGASTDKAGDMSNMNQDSGGMDHGSMSMQGGSAPTDARDPYTYAEGYDFGPLPRMDMGDSHYLHSLMVERLERVRTHDNSSTEYDLQAWFGRDYDRAVLKAEGDIDNGKLQEARTELLWGHALATYWDMQLGARYDSGVEPSRRWFAFGMQGLAPYWFEMETTAYIGEQGRTALRFAAEYELLLTQRLILQPRVEANVYGKPDAERALGSGLSDLVTGLRLRYEIRRELAPYVGIERSGKFGGTADYARDAGEDTHVTRLVAGLRFWF